MSFTTKALRQKFIDIRTHLENCRRSDCRVNRSVFDQALRIADEMVSALYTPEYPKRTLLDPLEAIAEGVVTEDNLDDVKFTEDGDRHLKSTLDHAAARHQATNEGKPYWCTKHKMFYAHLAHGMQSCGCKQVVKDPHGVYSKEEFEAEEARLKKLQEGV